jgi:26S proteasome regulatory subunit N6
MQIVRKLSQMILDKKLNASLDQGKGLLVLLPPLEEHVTAVKTVETIDLLGEVVDALRTRAEVYNAKLQEMCDCLLVIIVIVSLP